MYTDGQPYELGFFDPVYDDVEVTEETYQEEVLKGLWFFVAGIKILKGMKSIRFFYETDDGILLKSDTVPVLYYGAKGEPGAQGPRAPQYFGIFKPAAPEDGDWYLDPTTGYVYEYKDKAWKALDYETNSSKYMASINDAMGSLKMTDATLPIVKAMTAWINNLTANYAFINSLFAKKMTLQQGGVIKSSNYNGTANGGLSIDEIPEGEPITLDNNGTVGFAQDSNGNSDIVNLNATGGTFNNVKINGFFESNKTPFQPVAMVNIGYKDDTVFVISSKNVLSVARAGVGEYTIYFKTPVKLKTHSFEGKKYIDIIVIGNATDNLIRGLTNPLFVNPNWLHRYVDGRLPEEDDCVLVNYVVLYFNDNNSDELKDPRSAQCYIFATETN